MKDRLEALLMERKLNTLFHIVKYVPPREYPKLLDLDKEDTGDDFKDYVLDIVTSATELQADNEQMMLFDEALEAASKEILTEVQELGLREAIESTNAPITPELIAVYAMSKEVVQRPGHFEIELIGFDTSSLTRERETALAILIPELFDIVAFAGESDESFMVRTLEALDTVARVIRELTTE